MRHWFAICFLLIGLAACGMLPGKDAAGAAAPVSPLASEAIAVTSLDAPTSGKPASTSAVAEAPAPDGGASPWKEVAPAAVPVETPEVVKSESQLACEKQQGRYVLVGGTGARTCVKPTRDGGKQCRKDGDCSGQCLARSNTCAPMTPLLGCNEILQSDGRRVTLCLD